MTENNQIWFLLSRKLSGEISEPENKVLNELLQHHPDKHYIAEILHAWFHSNNSKTPEEDQEDIDIKLQRIISYDDNEIEFPGERRTVVRRMRVLGKYAAIVGGVSVVTWLSYALFFHNPKKEIAATTTTRNHINEIISNPGAKTNMRLPDGSRVWLNSSSKLSYQGDFNDAKREVTLEGEAFFDIAKNSSKPFIVHTNGIDIKVLGTAFNIKSYAGDETIEATLLRGAIEIIRKDDPASPAITLKPNEKLVFNKKSDSTNPPSPANNVSKHALPSENIDVIHIPVNIPDSNKTETSWVYNKLIFDGDNFTELARKMERWFNVSIVFEDEKIKNYRFKGVFANETIEEALDALKLTATFSYTISGTMITIHD